MSGETYTASDIKVLEKSGGRTGHYHRKATRP